VYGERGATTAGGGAPVRFNSPVGILEDRRGNVWIADTGANRIVIMDPCLDCVVETIGADAADPRATDRDLNMPFRLAHHPTDDAVLSTEMGAGRVVRFDYEMADGELAVRGTQTFTGSGPLHPNGVAAHQYPDGVRIFVADEFAQSERSLRSQIRVFDDDGNEVHTFSRVQDDGAADPLYWPQGIAVDDAGQLYIANTGAGILDTEDGANTYAATMLRCDRAGDARRFSGRADAVFAELAMPRDVTVVGRGEDRTILVPDAATGTLHAYGENGLAQWAYPSDAFDSAARRAAPEGGLADATRCGSQGADRAQPADGAAPRLQSPVGITPYSGPNAGNTGLLVTEAMSHEVRAMALDVAAPAIDPLAVTGQPREGEGVLNFPSAAAVVPTNDGPVTLIADSANGKLQRAGPGSGADLESVALPANQFPFGIAHWQAGDKRAVAIADFSTKYAERDAATQVEIYTVSDAPDGPWLEHRCGFGTWGLGSDELRLPRGIALDPVGPNRARCYVTEAGNGRIGVWEVDIGEGDATSVTDLGVFGHTTGMFWNPADVAIGDHGLYVADANNNRLQRYDGDTWEVFGEPGYARSRPAFLLPVSVGVTAGHLFVTDLVNRRIEVYKEPGPRETTLTLVDAVGDLGGHHRENEFWMPYALGLGEARGDAVRLVVPDGSKNIGTTFRWEPPS
jgi:DNA-binding beta-propeller fold protein YncE